MTCDTRASDSYIIRTLREYCDYFTIYSLLLASLAYANNAL